MDFGALPPEVNSGRMYLGPGAATLLAASAGWEALAAELHSAAGGYQAVITRLTDESWIGPSSASTLRAVTPYLQWMRTAAVQCARAATQANAAAAAYETAFAMTVPPPAIVTNRVRLATLIAANVLGQNTPAIAVTEAEYSEMWAQDATAMYNYAAGSSAASVFEEFTSPPQTTNLSGLVAQAGAAARTAGAETVDKVPAASAQLISSMPQALQNLAAPGGLPTSLGTSGSAPIGGLSSLSKTSGKGASAGLGTLSGPTANLEPVFSGNALDDTLGAFRTWGELGVNAPLDGLDQVAAAGLGHANALGTLSVPPSWADAASDNTPLPGSGRQRDAGRLCATPSGRAGPVSKLPSGATVRREYVRRQARTCRHR